MGVGDAAVRVATSERLQGKYPNTVNVNHLIVPSKILHMIHQGFKHASPYRIFLPCIRIQIKSIQIVQIVTVCGSSDLLQVLGRHPRNALGILHKLMHRTPVQNHQSD